MEVWRYRHRFEAAPNAKVAAGEVEGALVRSGDGYGCLQPWPKLGDEPLEAQLEALRRGSPMPPGEACLRCCEIDSAARRERRELLSGLKVPASHLLVEEIGTGTLTRAAEVSLVKVKSAALVEALAGVARVRVDFNATLDADGFRRFAASLSEPARAKIDFVEDPVPYDPGLWEELQAESGLRFALDRGPADATRGFVVRVWKPALTPDPPTGDRFCITHNMDHELGRRYAAYRAATFSGELVACGLGETDWAGGCGLGMDEELARLEWRAL